MKRFLLLFFLVLSLNAQPPTGQVLLSFNYPSNELVNGLSFNFYHSTSLTGWTLLTNFPATNTTYAITINPGQHFFFVTASNFWGESIPSNITNTPILATVVTNISITRTN
jgi:hypothetical protein